MTLNPRNRHAKPRWLLALALVAGGLLAAAGIALAVHDEGLFELDTSNDATICDPLMAPCGDANTADDPAGGADDWANVYKSYTGMGTAGPDHAFARTFVTDPVSSDENSFYTGGGSKDTRTIDRWAYDTTNDVVPDKDDIANAFAAAYRTDGTSPQTIVYFGMDRYDNSGDSETGFWFFRNTVTLDGNGGFDGEHSIGDVLVLADWGGSNPVGDITVYEWVGGKNPLQLVADNASADCAIASANDPYCAVVNRTTDNQPWPFLDKAGSTNIRPLELFEAGINLTQTFGEDRCFSSFLVATRSSHSTTAQLKDFSLQPFEQCGASITITPSAVNEVGQSHTFTVHVSQSVGGVAEGAEGVYPTVTLTPTNGAVVAGLDDQCASAGTDSSGNCTVTFTSNSTGVVTGHAAADVLIGSDTFSVETDGVAPNSGDAVKRFVDAKIGVTPLTATNEVGTAHKITATVQQDDGLAAADGGDGVTGWANAPDGTTVTFSLLNNTAGAAFVGDVNTCTTTSGTCFVWINSDTPGSVDIRATATFFVGGVSLTRTTGSGGNNSADANKVYETGALKILKNSTKGGAVLVAGAVFSVEGALLDSGFQVVDNGANDNDPAIGVICVGGLKPGSDYTVNEVSPPAGYGSGATATGQDVTAVSGFCDAEPYAVFDSSSTATFVNPPLFDIQVNYRDGGSGETGLKDGTTIECVDTSGGSPSSAVTDGWDDSLTVTGIPVPVSGEITLTCTLTVDP